MLKILFAAPAQYWPEYQAPLNAAFAGAGLQFDLSCDHPPAEVDYIIFAPGGTITDFAPYTKAKAVMTLWAGVETIVSNQTLTQPLCRMVDNSLSEGMVEWVTAHVLRYHMGLDDHIQRQDGVWRNTVYPPLARDRPVTILGIGELGAACGQALQGLGFPVTGWSRAAKDIPNIRCLHGPEGLDAALTGAKIVVTLLPLTPQTENLMDAERLALMAPGAFVINPGRGPLIDDDALLAALDSGHIAHATLDVFRVEPLPAEHAYWAHPKVTVTPHIAATTRAATSAGIIADNIKRGESGEVFLHLVDRGLGY